MYSETENQVSEKDGDDSMDPTSANYNIEFVFDSDVKCAITIYYFATEEIVNKQAMYTSCTDVFSLTSRAYTKAVAPEVAEVHL